MSAEQESQSIENTLAERMKDLELVVQRMANQSIQMESTQSDRLSEITQRFEARDLQVTRTVDQLKKNNEDILESNRELKKNNEDILDSNRELLGSIQELVHQRRDRVLHSVAVGTEPEAPRQYLYNRLPGVRSILKYFSYLLLVCVVLIALYAGIQLIQWLYFIISESIGTRVSSILASRILCYSLKVIVFTPIVGLFSLIFLHDIINIRYPNFDVINSRLHRYLLIMAIFNFCFLFIIIMGESFLYGEATESMKLESSKRDYYGKLISLSNPRGIVEIDRSEERWHQKEDRHGDQFLTELVLPSSLGGFKMIVSIVTYKEGDLRIVNQIYRGDYNLGIQHKLPVRAHVQVIFLSREGQQKIFLCESERTWSEITNTYENICDKNIIFSKFLEVGKVIFKFTPKGLLYDWYGSCWLNVMGWSYPTGV